MHRWHHANWWKGYGFNYGTKLAIWDWIFGTAYLPETKPPGYGLTPASQATYPNGRFRYFLQLGYAFRRFEPGPLAKNEAPEPPPRLIAPATEPKPQPNEASTLATSA